MHDGEQLASWRGPRPGLRGVATARRRDGAAAPQRRAEHIRGVCAPQGEKGDSQQLPTAEAVVLRFMGGDGKPYNTFFNLAPLDLSTVHDKRSPDADCITACYATSLEQLQLEAHAGLVFKCHKWARESPDSERREGRAGSNTRSERGVSMI